MPVKRNGQKMATPPLREATKQREIAARMLAEGKYTEPEIGAAVGVHRITVAKWKRVPEFRVLIDRYRQEMSQAMLRVAIAQRERRVVALQDQWERMQRIVAERADEMSEVGEDGKPTIPGGASGLLTRQYKSIGSGEHAEKVEEYRFDKALSEELREVQKQAAQELGQWTERREVTAQVEGEFTLVELMAAWLKGGA